MVFDLCLNWCSSPLPSLVACGCGDFVAIVFRPTSLRSAQAWVISASLIGCSSTTSAQDRQLAAGGFRPTPRRSAQAWLRSASLISCSSTTSAPDRQLAAGGHPGGKPPVLVASAPDEKEFRALALLVRGSGEPTGMEAWCERCRQHPRYANCLRCRRNICRGCTKIAFQGATYCFPCWHKIAPDDGLVIDALSMASAPETTPAWRGWQRSGD